MQSKKAKTKRKKIYNEFLNLKNFFAIFFDDEEWNYSTVEEKNFYSSYYIKNIFSNQKNNSILINFFKILIIFTSPILLLLIYLYSGIFLIRFIYKNNISKLNYYNLKNKLQKNNNFIIKHLPNISSIKNTSNNFIDKEIEFIYRPFIDNKRKFFSIFKNIYFNESKKNTPFLEHLIIKEDIFKIFVKCIFTSLVHITKLCIMIFRSNNSFSPYLIIDLINSLLGKRFLEIQIYKKIFQKFNNIISNDSIIIYISENQFWEKILNYYNNEIQTFSIFLNKNRFWDLKYCHSINNDPFSKKLLPKNIISKFKDDISEYKTFNSYSIFHHINFNKSKFNINKSSKIKNVVIYGDYQKKNTLKLLNELELNISKFKNNYNYFFKKHPNQNYIVSLPQFIKGNPHKDIINKRHLAIVIDSSSIGLDCLLNNNIVVTILSDNSINMSPISSLLDNDLFFFDTLENFNNKVLNISYFNKNKFNFLLSKKFDLNKVFFINEKN